MKLFFMTSEKIYNPSLDVGKFIAAIFVVCLHSRPFYGTPFDYVLNLFFVMAVPFFFCTSSYLFYSRKGSLIKYIKRLLQIYFVWLVIEFPYVYLRFFSDGISIRSLSFFIWNLLFLNTFLASWYLMASILAILIVDYLYRNGYIKQLIIIGGLCFILSLLGSMYNGLLSYVPKVGGGN